MSTQQDNFSFNFGQVNIGNYLIFFFVVKSVLALIDAWAFVWCQMEFYLVLNHERGKHTGKKIKYRSYEIIHAYSGN